MKVEYPEGSTVGTRQFSTDAIDELRRMQHRLRDNPDTDNLGPAFYFGMNADPDPIFSPQDKTLLTKHLAERGFIEQILEYIFALSLREYCTHYQKLDGSAKYTFLTDLKFFMPGPQSSKMLQSYFGTSSKTELETLFQKLLTHVKTPSMSEKGLKQIIEAIRALPEKERVLLPDGHRPLSLLKKELEIIIPSAKLYLPFCPIIDERVPRVVDALKKIEHLNDPTGHRTLEVIFQDQTH